MEFRRRMIGTDTLVTEVRSGPDAEWSAATGPVAGYPSPFTESWEVRQAVGHGAKDGSVVLPFQPLSFRDFMLFEQHNVNAARGWARRFRPGLARIADGVESVTRKTFPAFRPKPLWYRKPIYYMSNASTFVPSGTPVAAPPYSSALDYELELAFVLRAPLYNATPEEAVRAIGAFVVLCDFSARDVQIAEMNSNFGPQKSKHFMTSLSSTAVEAADILDRWTTLPSAVSLNGEIVARPDSGSPKWSLGEMLAHSSAGERLYPGELCATGTYVNGSGMEINRWLAPGDVLRLEIEGVGTIEHAIVSHE
ncbi:fumarylacetoacetate hydrolase family protein [Streptomyces sp. NPDC018964]|uniref:fumarylacetoacetate hydrolase family protein n=1 Tax=unclassified Streptomyces TaxID=2593676 RepID=UPI0037BC3DDE